MTDTALVIGFSGIIGGNLTRELRRQGWDVYGASRTARNGNVERVHSISANLLDADEVRDALAHTSPTHVFITAWSRRRTEAAPIAEYVVSAILAFEKQFDEARVRRFEEWAYVQTGRVEGRIPGLAGFGARGRAFAAFFGRRLRASVAPGFATLEHERPP